MTKKIGTMENDFLKKFSFIVFEKTAAHLSLP